MNLDEVGTSLLSYKIFRGSKGKPALSIVIINVQKKLYVNETMMKNFD